MGRSDKEQDRPEAYYEDEEQAISLEDHKDKLFKMGKTGKAQETLNRRLMQESKKAAERAPTIFRLRADFLLALQTEASEALTELHVVAAKHEEALRYHIDTDWDIAKKQGRHEVVQELKAWSSAWHLNDSQGDWVLRAALHTLVKSVRLKDKVEGFTYSSLALMPDFDFVAPDRLSSSSHIFEFTYKTVVNIDKDSKKNFIKRVEEEVRLEVRRFVQAIETQKLWEYPANNQAQTVTQKKMIKEPSKPATAALARYVKDLRDESFRSEVLHSSTLDYETVGYPKRKLEALANQIGLYIEDLNRRP